MAVRVDLKVRKNEDNDDFEKALSEFCKKYSEENDCAIEFDTQDHRDVQFFWWEEVIYKDTVSSGYVTHQLKKMEKEDQEAYRRYQDIYSQVAKQTFSKVVGLEAVIQTVGYRAETYKDPVSLPALKLLYEEVTRRS